jgi:hypothetical protein
MYIINQSRDSIVEYNPSELKMKTIIEGNKLRGFAALHKKPEFAMPIEEYEPGEVLIAFLDTPEEYDDLEDMINLCTEPYFCVPAFGEFEYEVD